MNALNKWKEDHNVPAQELALAWLQLTFEGVPHPDDWLQNDYQEILTSPENWGGWKRDLCKQIFETIADTCEAADALRYAWFPQQLVEGSLPMLRSFHQDLGQAERELLDACDTIQDFFNDVDADKLDKAILALDRLATYHQDGPEDVCDPVYTALQVLTYIKTL